MFVYSVLNYFFLSLMCALIIFDADSAYVLASLFVLLVLGFAGPGQTGVASFKAVVSKNLYWWSIILFVIVVLMPFYHVGSGRDLLNFPAASLKIAAVVLWAGVTMVFLQGVYFVLLKDKR